MVIPCLNEEKSILSTLEMLAAQWDPARYEIIVVDGMSDDATRERILQFRKRHPEIRTLLIDNPRRHIPAALNLGIRAARGEVIVRMDGHSIPSLNYVASCVKSLFEVPGVKVVGMPWRISPGADTLVAKSIAKAVSHRFGIGDAKYRLAGAAKREIVDTVPFGVFHKATWEQLGGFNEELLANEDYEFNYRVRAAGGRILLDRSGYCEYLARSTFVDLARQYWRYGTWKLEMLRRYPQSIRWRQLAPPAFVASVALSAAPTVFWAPAAYVLVGALLAYLVTAVTVAIRVASRSRDIKLAPAIALSFAIVHLAWGSAVLAGPLLMNLRAVRRKKHEL